MRGQDLRAWQSWRYVHTCSNIVFIVMFCHYLQIRERQQEERAALLQRQVLQRQEERTALANRQKEQRDIQQRAAEAAENAVRVDAAQGDGHGHGHGHGHGQVEDAATAAAQQAVQHAAVQAKRKCERLENM